MTQISTLSDLKADFRIRANDLDLSVQCPMDGNFNARYAVVGEGPGQEEVNQGLPFIGHSGRLLWDTLRNQRLLRTDFYITNVSKRQISLAKNTRYPVSAEEWAKWRMLIQWELEQLPNLEHILLLGNAGIQAFFGWEGVKKYRGSVYEWKGRKVTVTLNPAAVLREPKEEIVFKLDIARFRNVINGDHAEYPITAHINPTFTEAVEFVRECKGSIQMPSYDIEVISNETACHGLAISPHEAMCINLRDEFENRYSIEEETKLLFELQTLFDAKSVIAQNGNFDAHWTGYKDLLRIKIGFDTLLAHHTLYPTLPHNLGFLTSQYTTHPYYKDEIDIYKEGGDINSFWNYNCKDAAITFGIAQRELEELKIRKLDKFFFEHVMKLEPHLVQTTVDGLAVDTDIKDAIAAELKTSTDAVVKQFHQMAQEATNLHDMYVPNLNSPLQMKELFFNKLKLKSTDGGFDEAARTKLMNDSRTGMEAQGLILKYNEFKKADKFRSTYAEQQVDPDHRTRYVFKQYGVVSAPGRLSSSGTLWGTGMNMQNQPKAAYKFYLADDGTVMFYFDLSQAEARVVAFLADIEQWKEDFERARLNPGSFDAHCSLASTMYNIPYADVPTDDVDKSGNFTIRYKAKRCRHGLNYTMQWPRLAETTGMSAYESRKSYILYHKTNPQIQAWWRQIEIRAKKDRKLITPFGRELPIMERIDPNNLGNLVAFVPQSTIGDKVKQVWYQCHEDDEWDMSKMRIKLNIHDALIGIAHPDYAKKALSIAIKYAEQPIIIEDIYKRKVEPLIIPADPAISEPDEYGKHRWSTLKKVKNLEDFQVRLR